MLNLLASGRRLSKEELEVLAKELRGNVKLEGDIHSRRISFYSLNFEQDKDIEPILDRFGLRKVEVKVGDEDGREVYRLRESYD